MRQQIEDVLEAYAGSDPGPSRAALTEWTARYPEFARELTAFTARWQLLAWTADAEPDAKAGELAAGDELAVLRGMSAAQAAFYNALARRQAARVRDGAASIHDAASDPHRGGTSAVADAPPVNLIRDAQQRGLSADALAERVGLSSVLLSKLNRRLIAPGSIPLRVLTDVGDALGRSLAAVRAYMERPPTFTVGAQHRANQAPALPSTREDFFAAVAGDLSLDDARRGALLALPRPEVPQSPPDGPPQNGPSSDSRGKLA